MTGKFEPKTPVTLAEPKSDVITVEELAKCNGKESNKCYVAIKGTVFDVSDKASYREGGSYSVFAGKDASRALAMTSVEPEDVRANLEDLSDTQKKTLDDWFTFFSKRYNIVGVVEGATNMGEPASK